jgi:membrane protease YdiL (CAAX protease family)
MKKHRLSVPQAFAAGTLITAAAAIWFWRVTHDAGAAVFMVLPGIAFTAMLLLGSDQVLERLQSWIQTKPSRIALIPVGLWLLYVVYSIGMGIAGTQKALIMAIYISLPFLVLTPFRMTRRQLWLEPLVILWIWLPLEFGIVRRLLLTGRGGDLHYALTQILALDTAIIAFAVWSRTPDIGYRFETNRSTLTAGLKNFLAFAAIAIPLGLAIGFIAFSFGLSKLAIAPLQFIGIFLFTALPEEFLFRGLIQNWLQRATGGRTASLLIASVIFGASHLNNGPPIPNYRYFLLATIAGIFYGRAWQRTGSLMASGLTHALVDTFWSMLFR